MKQETIAIGADSKRHIEFFGVVESLLHAVADAVVVVFGLDNGNWLVLLETKHVVCAAWGGTAMQAASHHDPAGADRKLLPHLGLDVPSRRLNGGGDEFGADISLAELLFIQIAHYFDRSSTDEIINELA